MIIINKFKNIFIMTTLEDLKQQVEELNDNSSYTKAANLVTKVFNIKLKVLDKGCYVEDL